MFRAFKNTFFLAILGISFSISAQNTEKQILIGANQTQKYLPLLKGKRVGVVTNQTGVLLSSENKPIIHLIDTLLNLKVAVRQIFVPEHGLRGTADAGEHIKNGIDAQTQLPIISLYGKNKKPSATQLSQIDVVLFDIQDIGVRFYTYISTLHYVMEACAEQRIPLIILDRPNPNGNQIDGPILEEKFKSFVGLHPVPILHGMTIGEYAQMINGEKWLQNGVSCSLTIILIENYNHQMPYSLPVKPSPNLPNDKAINLYASLCFFEGTNVSVGRGTENQFQIYGSPYLEKTDFSFIPQPNEGAKNPLYKGIICYGENLENSPNVTQLNLKWLQKAYAQSVQVKTPFFTNFFNLLAGNSLLKEQISKQISEKEIRKSWQNGLKKYQLIRKKYLLYP